MTVKHWLISILTVIFLTTVTALVTLYASGYRLDFKDHSLQGTGIIAVSSQPDGALIYLNGVPKDATNASITGLKPGQYQLRLEKQGFAAWERETEVEKELVTSERALLIPLFPEFKPLTFTGVQNPLLSPDGQRVLYTAGSNGESGIWLLDLAERPFDLTNWPVLLVRDTVLHTYSQAQLSWTPDGNSFLISFADRSVLYDLATNTSLEVKDVEQLRKEWLTEQKEARDKLLENYDEDVQLMVQKIPNTEWSPDNGKLLYQQASESDIDYRVLDLKPGPVTPGSKPKPREYTALTANKDKYIRVLWFADSEHLLVLEKESAEETTGTIALVGMDGTNWTEVFTGTVVDAAVYPSPNGSKIIVLTTFNPANLQNNLYAIVLR